MRLVVEGDLFEWRGPAPYHFVAVGPEGCDDLRAVAPVVSYGWGMIPVRGTVGATAFTTSLWPHDGGYVVPIRDAVRLAEGLTLGATVTVQLEIDTDR